MTAEIGIMAWILWGLIVAVAAAYLAAGPRRAPVRLLSPARDRRRGR